MTVISVASEIVIHFSVAVTTPSVSTLAIRQNLRELSSNSPEWIILLSSYLIFPWAEESLISVFNFSPVRLI